MKRFIMLVVLIAVFPVLAGAEYKLYEAEGKSLNLKGEIVMRPEYVKFFEPKGPYDNDYLFGFTRTKIGLEYKSKSLDIFIQGQNTNVLGLPDNAIAPAPQGLLGVGAIYYRHGFKENYTSTHLKQGYLKLKFQPFTFTVGRFDYMDGEEVLYKDDPKLTWLKKVRISERLIGPFAWSAFQRSFDGGWFTYDHPNLNLTLIAMRPTQGGFENDAGKEIEDIDVGYGALTLKKGLIPYSDARLFYIYYKDDRAGVTKTDNLPAGSPLGIGDIKINTFGFHLASAYKPTKDNVMDLLLWGALQSGDWGRLDQKSWALNGEIGYQFLNVALKPWFRAGYFVSSGDDNPADNEHGTFFQVLPTVRKQSPTPTYYNYMNIEDLFAMVILKPSPKSTLRIDGNILKLNNSNDRWYFGSGATQKTGLFGYIGRPSQGAEDIGTLFGIHLFYDFTKYLGGYAYYSHMWGGDVVTRTFPAGDEADYFYVELAYKF